MAINYLIIGNGRCAKHFDHYISLLCIPHRVWARHQRDDFRAVVTGDAELETLANEADRILLLISDSAISDFFESHPFLPRDKTLHFSGALNHPKIFGVHPLMTFGHDLYDFDFYKKIPFVCETARPGVEARSFDELLPGLPNPCYFLAPEKKAYYHALCTMAGNFTTLLWETAFRKFDHELGLPRSVLLPYLERTCENLALELKANQMKSVLTGPLQRGDSKTLIQHLDALQGTIEQSLYYSFVNYFFKRANSPDSEQAEPRLPTGELSRGEFL